MSDQEESKQKPLRDDSPSAVSQEKDKSIPQDLVNSKSELAKCDEILKDLRSTIDRAGEQLRMLAVKLPVDEPKAIDKTYGHLKQELSDIKTESEEMANRLVQAEQLAGRLMSLYVAIFQLHDTLDPIEVQDNIGEIAIDLLGAEKLVVVISSPEGNRYDVTIAIGIEDDSESPYRDGRYRPPVPMIDQTLSDGVMRFGSCDESEPVAVVPLLVRGETVGALIILKLLDHKPALLPEDRELLDLLAAHAASALMAARAFAKTDRRVQSLESLIKLARPE